MSINYFLFYIFRQHKLKMFKYFKIIILFQLVFAQPAPDQLTTTTTTTTKSVFEQTGTSNWVRLPACPQCPASDEYCYRPQGYTIPIICVVSTSELSDFLAVRRFWIRNPGGGSSSNSNHLLQTQHLPQPPCLHKHLLQYTLLTFAGFVTAIIVSLIIHLFLLYFNQTIDNFRQLYLWAVFNGDNDDDDDNNSEEAAEVNHRIIIKQDQ
jgi:hypothetical protein